jgi:hypothetical protein
MVLNQADRTITFRRAYGKAAPPEKVTQEAFEGNDRHLRRLLRIKPGERPDVQDLWEYLQDLRYTDIQSSLLAYLLPFCLELWCEDLRGTSDKYGGFVEHLYPVLADRAIFDKHLTGTPGIGTAMTTLSSPSEVSYCVVSRLVAGSTGGTNLIAGRYRSFFAASFPRRPSRYILRQRKS